MNVGLYVAIAAIAFGIAFAHSAFTTEYQPPGEGEPTACKGAPGCDDDYQAWQIARGLTTTTGLIVSAGGGLYLWRYFQRRNKKDSGEP